ncbi:uncharacterized protein LOC131007132 [Salvia miltiorrhiza]|uniref:uncharacterized protein LOC131007132 n=1 Tax=Salvia miltiorrhiza TaxID=226208 RepID=UPI0025AD4C6B|nr:uncharacterized protein LOC131007132 [Salvia miltiorrhiza]
MAPATPSNTKNPNQLPPYEDPSSPYFLPMSHNPGVQLVTQQLNGSNYTNWNRSMITALIAKNKLAFIDGSIPRPHHTDLLFTQWMRCNSMVVSWIRNSVIPDISSSIMYIDDAAHIWNDLKDRFSQGNLARICQLKQQLFTLQQGSDDVGVYFTKLRVLWDEYRDYQPARWCVCDNCRCHSSKKWMEYQMQDCSMQFLIGLNPSFSQIRSQIISTTPLPPLSKIFALVLQEERQRSIDFVPQMSQMAGDTTGSIINSTGYAKGRGAKGKFLCTHCGRTNHTVDKCFALVGYPPGYGRGRGKPSGYTDDINSKAVHQTSAGDGIGDTKGTAGLSHTDMIQMIYYLQSQMQISSASSPTGAYGYSSGDVVASTQANNYVPAQASPPFSGSFSGDCDWEG